MPPHYRRLRVAQLLLPRLAKKKNSRDPVGQRLGSPGSSLTCSVAKLIWLKRLGKGKVVKRKSRFVGDANQR